MQKWEQARGDFDSMLLRATACRVQLEFVEASDLDGDGLLPEFGVCVANAQSAELNVVFVVEADDDPVAGVCVRFPMSGMFGRGKTERSALRDLGESIVEAASVGALSDVVLTVNLCDPLDPDLDAKALRLLRVRMVLAFNSRGTDEGADS